MRSRIATAALFCAAILIFSLTAFADNIKTDFDHHANFTEYHTYSWGAVKVSDQLNAARIRRSVNASLQRDGWKEVSTGGQVTVMATDKVHTEQEAESYYDGMGGGWGGGWGGWGGWGWGDGGGFGGMGESMTTMSTTRNAHVVIDIFNTSTKRLLWRGVSRAELTNKPADNRKRLDEDIAKMFKDFPPKPHR